MKIVLYQTHTDGQWYEMTGAKPDSKGNDRPRTVDEVNSILGDAELIRSYIGNDDRGHFTIHEITSLIKPGIKVENNWPPRSTPTPWRMSPKQAGTIVCETPPQHWVKVSESEKRQHLDYYGGYCVAESMTQPDVDRVVACINACGSIPTEQLNRGVIESLLKISTLAARVMLEIRINGAVTKGLFNAFHEALVETGLKTMDPEMRSAVEKLQTLVNGLKEKEQHHSLCSRN